jgi:hypothetical protein
MYAHAYRYHVVFIVFSPEKLQFYTGKYRITLLSCYRLWRSGADPLAAK